MGVYLLIKNTILHYKSSLISLLSDSKFVSCDIPIYKEQMKKNNVEATMFQYCFHLRNNILSRG